MKNIIFLLVVLSIHIGFSQTIDPGIKDCLEGSYTWTDGEGNKHHLKLTSTLTTEYTGYVYEGGTKGPIGNRSFVMYGKWGADENNLNVITGTFKNADQYKDDKSAPEYYAWHFQNSGSKGAYDLDKGTVVFMGNTYTRDSGPCSQAKLKENEENKQGQDKEPQKPAPTLIYTGSESNLQKLKDDYIKEFSSDGTYNAYVAGENLKRLGTQMAKNLSSNLSSIGSLNSTLNPSQLLSEFNSKMESVESLEATFNEESNRFFFASGQQIGNSINSEDYETAIHQFGGVLNSYLDRKEAEKELLAKRVELYIEREAQMNKILFKALDFNESMQDKYYKMAAFAEHSDEEKYYLDFVKNLECYHLDLRANFTPSNTSWLSNNCSIPQKSNFNKIENTFVTEDVKFSKIAERKYTYFEETGVNHYRDAAISFASAAANKSKKATYFIQIAEYYIGYSDVLALGNFLTAAAIDQNSLNNDQKLLVEDLKFKVKLQIEQALRNNNQEFLSTFLGIGLDKAIYVNEKDVLEYAIELDQPDAMQLILNKRTEGDSQKDIQRALKETIFICAIRNSPNCITRFDDLGVSVDFETNGMHPIEVAEKVLAVDSYRALMSLSSRKNEFTNKFKDSHIEILVLAESSPEQAVKKLEEISNDITFPMVVDRMIEQLDKKTNYFIALDQSHSAKSYLYSKEAMKKVQSKFYEEMVKPFDESKADLFVKYNLLNLNHVPSLSEVGIESFKTIVNQRECPGGLARNCNVIKKNQIFNGSDNLAYVAWVTKHPKLFHELDDQFNMNEVICPDGKTLFEKMLSTQNFTRIGDFGLDVILNYMTFNSIYKSYDSNNPVEDYITKVYLTNEHYAPEVKTFLSEQFKFALSYFKYRHLFYSKDFDFKRKINGNYPIFNYLNAIRDKVTSVSNPIYINDADAKLLLASSYETVELLTNYTFDKNQVNMQDGGTLLHLYIDLIAESTKGGQRSSVKFPEYEFIQSLGVDTKIKDAKGRTAAGLFKEKKKMFYAYGAADIISKEVDGYNNLTYYSVKWYYDILGKHLSYKAYASLIIK